MLLFFGNNLESQANIYHKNLYNMSSITEKPPKMKQTNASIDQLNQLIMLLEFTFAFGIGRAPGSSLMSTVSVLISAASNPQS